MEKLTLKQFEDLTGWKPPTIRKMIHEDYYGIKEMCIPGVIGREKIGRDWFLVVQKNKLKKVC